MISSKSSWILFGLFSLFTVFVVLWGWVKKFRNNSCYSKSCILCSPESCICLNEKHLSHYETVDNKISTCLNRNIIIFVGILQVKSMEISLTPCLHLAQRWFFPSYRWSGFYSFFEIWRKRWFLFTVNGTRIQGIKLIYISSVKAESLKIEYFHWNFIFFHIYMYLDRTLTLGGSMLHSHTIWKELQ